MSRPIIALAGLTACSGCQLTLLNCEEELASLTDYFEFAYFPMGISAHPECIRIDAAFVEGAVSTPEDVSLLLWLRSSSRILIAFGTCAMWGGVAAMNNHLPRMEMARTVYGKDTNLRTFNPAPFSRFVSVDFSIPGCPPEKEELLTTLASLRWGTLPPPTCYPVCTECRNRENRCLLIEDNQLCLGPIIKAGCNARCPAVGIVCEGCRGPAPEVNAAAEIELLREKGFDADEVMTRMRRFCPEWNYDRRY